MQLKILNKLIILTAVVLLTASGSMAEPNSFKDERDGQVYKTVKIGKQVWMAENLNYETEESYCYDDETANCKKYGRLYTWDDAMNSCPAGFHLPSNDEWRELIVFMGGGFNKLEKDVMKYAEENKVTQSEIDDYRYSLIKKMAAKVGTYLKSKTNWKSDNDAPVGTDKYGFNGLLAGCRSSAGSYYDMGDCAEFWSSTEYTRHHACFYRLLYSHELLGNACFGKTGIRSVRCLKDSK